MATAFPENDIRAQHEYLPPSLVAAVSRVLSELNRVIAPNLGSGDPWAPAEGPPLRPEERKVHRATVTLNDTRRAVATVLRSIANLDAGSNGITALRAVCRSLASGQAREAISSLETFPSDGAPQLAKATLSAALAASGGIYFVKATTTKFINNNPNKEVTTKENAPKSLPGFSPSKAFTSSEEAELMTLVAFLSPGTPERLFRLAVLKGDALFHARDHARAVQAYGLPLPPSALRKIPTPDSLARDDLLLPDFFPTSTSPRVKFLALRCARAQLEAAERLLRRTRRPTPDERSVIEQAFQSALSWPGAAKVMPSNPLLLAIEARVELQLLRLQNGRNSLGLAESVVPRQTASALKQAAFENITRAKDAAQKYERFQLQAQDFKRELNELGLERALIEIEKDISEKRIKIAQQRIEELAVQREAVQTQLGELDSLLADSAKVFSVAQSAALGLALPTKGQNAQIAAQLLGSIAGVSGLFASSNAREEELKSQQQVLALQSASAELEKEIAAKDKEALELRAKFTEGAMRTLTEGSELTADVFMEAAGIMREIALSAVRAATQWAYLYERAVAFRFALPSLRAISLDYEDRGPLFAADELDGDLQTVSNAELKASGVNVPQLVRETYSLRSLFPLEFAHLLQSGEMHFQFSLYELSKRFPQAARQRILAAQLLVKPEPVGGYAASLTHRGIFMLRDTEATLSDDVQRFAPSNQAIAQALDSAGPESAQSVAVGGVIVMSPGPSDPRLFGSNQPASDNDGASAHVNDPLFGYGINGSWTLQLRGLDLQSVFDVALEIVSEPAANDALGRKVKELAKRYEEEVLGTEGALDRIAVVSVARQFPQQFDSLPTGVLTVGLANEHFPPNTAERRLKIIVAQFLDRDLVGVPGVTVRFSRADRPEFTLEGRSGPSGLSADLDNLPPFLAPAERFPVEGSYRIEVGVPPGAEIADLVLFVMYEYQTPQ